MLVSLLLLQAAAQMPDLELRANVRARSLTIHKQGDAKLAIRTSPEGADVVDVRAPKANGRKTIRDINVHVRAEAKIGKSQQGRVEGETSQPE